MKKIILLLFASMFMCLTIDAQPQQPSSAQPPQPPKMRSSEDRAKEQADLMNSELQLSSKQYKQVYKLLLKDFNYREQSFGNRPSSMPQGGPGGGMPGGGGMMGGPGGGMPGGGGMMGGPGGGMPGGGGMMGGPGGGTPPQGNFEGQAPGNMPQFGPKDDLVTDEYLQEQDSKLKKILTDDQYRKWRSKHPAERLELPPLEF